jgi:hypothetical protein
MSSTGCNLRLFYPAKNLEFNLSNARIRIGRAAGLELSIPQDPSISSNHCIITNGVLIDPQSTNGTNINDKPINRQTPYPLKPGDKITMGDATLIIQLNTASNTTSNIHTPSHSTATSGVKPTPSPILKSSLSSSNSSARRTSRVSFSVNSPTVHTPSTEESTEEQEGDEEETGHSSSEESATKLEPNYTYNTENSSLKEDDEENQGDGAEEEEEIASSDDDDVIIHSTDSNTLNVDSFLNLPKANSSAANEEESSSSEEDADIVAENENNDLDSLINSTTAPGKAQSAPNSTGLRSWLTKSRLSNSASVGAASSLALLSGARNYAHNSYTEDTEDYEETKLFDEEVRNSAENNLEATTLTKLISQPAPAGASTEQLLAHYQTQIDRLEARISSLNKQLQVQQRRSNMVLLKAKTHKFVEKISSLEFQLQWGDGKKTVQINEIKQIIQEEEDKTVQGLQELMSSNNSNRNWGKTTQDLTKLLGTAQTQLEKYEKLISGEQNKQSQLNHSIHTLQEQTNKEINDLKQRVSEIHQHNEQILAQTKEIQAQISNSGANSSKTAPNDSNTNSSALDSNYLANFKGFLNETREKLSNTKPITAPAAVSKRGSVNNSSLSVMASRTATLFSAQKSIIQLQKQFIQNKINGNNNNNSNNSNASNNSNNAAQSSSSADNSSANANAAHSFNIILGGVVIIIAGLFYLAILGK